MALSLSPTSSLENLVVFLDTTSCLRSINLPDMDLGGETAVCFFVNIYHSLLQHALLLLGPPTKSSVTHFMRCVCYEIGNDVFSLAELECVRPANARSGCKRTWFYDDISNWQTLFY